MEGKGGETVTIFVFVTIVLLCDDAVRLQQLSAICV